RANDDTSQKLLHVAIRNALRLVLNRPHGAIQSSHGKEVRKRVIGLLSCLHERFVALFAASDDLEGDVEGIDLDALYLASVEAVRGSQLEHGFDGGLSVDLGVVALD